MTLGLLFVLSDFRYIAWRTEVSTSWIKLWLNDWALLDSRRQEKCMALGLFCGWGVTWGDTVRYSRTGGGDRAPGKSAKGTRWVSRLRVLERGLKYRWSLRRGSPQSLLDSGYFTSTNLDLRALYPCNWYDEVAVLRLGFQYSYAFFKHCQGPSQLSQSCSAECSSSAQSAGFSSLWVSRSLRQNCRKFYIF